MLNENNKLNLYCAKFINSKDIHIKINKKNYLMIIENENGLITYYNGNFYFLI